MFVPLSVENIYVGRGENEGGTEGGESQNKEMKVL